MMQGYYEKKLSAERLRKCYDIAPPRVRQYFASELSHVLRKIYPGEKVLDLGCGFGRILPNLARKAGIIVGIDNSHASLILAQETIEGLSNCFLIETDAVQLSFIRNTFDLVICIQNGISAFHLDQKELIMESIRVTKPGGTVLFSSYSDKFWDHRLEWFQKQADAGLLGEIDYDKTGDGLIVCKDGFKATTMGPSQFLALTSDLDVEVEIVEVDESTLFYEITL